MLWIRGFSGFQPVTSAAEARQWTIATYPRVPYSQLLDAPVVLGCVRDFCIFPLGTRATRPHLAQTSGCVEKRAETLGCALTFRSLDTLPKNCINHNIFLLTFSYVRDSICVQWMHGVEKCSFLPQILECWRIDQWCSCNAFSKLRV